jgi:hypothetical protein
LWAENNTNKKNSKNMEKIKKLGLIITSVILFAACETNHTCECKYTYWGFTGDLESGASYIFKSGETPCEYFEGKDVHEEVDAFDHIGDKYYECKEVD